MPGKFFIQIVSYKIEDIHTHTGRSYDAPVTIQVFQVTDQHQFEKHNRINTLLALCAIIFGGGIINKGEIEYPFQPSVEIISRNIVRKLKPDKELFLIILFALHALNIQNKALNIKYLCKKIVQSDNIRLDYLKIPP